MIADSAPLASYAPSTHPSTRPLTCSPHTPDSWGIDVRIGILYPAANPLAETNWSGTPAGLAGGLTELGVDIVPIGAPLPLGLRQAVGLASRLDETVGGIAGHAPATLAARERAMRRAVASAGRLDGLVAMGTDLYDLRAVAPAHTAVATYDDSTLRQMWDHPDSDLRATRLQGRHVDGWAAGQARSLRAADVCCVATAWAGRSLHRDCGVPTRQIRVVGIGHRRAGTTATTGNGPDRPSFFVGVDWRRKNGDAVLRAFTRLRAERPDSTLHVVGRHPALDIPGVRGHGMLKLDGAEDQARLTGLFGTATAFVMPSRFEPAGIAYLEAAANGMAVIATDQGGGPEILGDAAVQVGPDDDDALFQALRLLSDPTEARQRGAQARRMAAVSRWRDVALRILDALDHDPPTVRKSLV